MTDRPIFGVTPAPDVWVSVCECGHVLESHRTVGCVAVTLAGPCECDRYEKAAEEPRTPATARPVR